MDYTPIAPAFIHGPENGGISALVERVRQFFALPVELPRHIAERQEKRGINAVRVLEFLGEDGILKLSGLHLGKIARALGIKRKRIEQALRDLAETGVFEGRTVTLYGNKCGHDPERPRYFRAPTDHKRHPLAIERLVERIRAYYVDPRGTLPCLNFARPFTGNKDRQRRSERREACIDILAAILWHTDLVTLKVGVFTGPGEFVAGIPMASKTVTTEDGQQRRIVGLAELAGLSLSRAEEAIRDLKAAGIVTVHEIVEKIDAATYRGYSAVRTVSKNLWEAFGMGGFLKHERERASEKMRKKNQKRAMQKDGNGAANVAMMMGAQRKKKGRNKAVQEARQQAQVQNRNGILFRLMEQFPDRVNEIGALMSQHPAASADDLADILLGITGPPS